MTPRFQGGAPLLWSLALHFDLHARRRHVAGTPHRERHVAITGGEVVVLDENRAREIHAMVDAAAGAHGVLLEYAPPRRRLARVEDLDLRAFDDVHETRRQRRDAGPP